MQNILINYLVSLSTFNLFTKRSGKVFFDRISQNDGNIAVNIHLFPIYNN